MTYLSMLVYLYMLGIIYGPEGERLNIWITMEAKHCIAHYVFLVYLMAGITGNIAVLAIHKTILQD